jgi:hypothetical protein
MMRSIFYIFTSFIILFGCASNAQNIQINTHYNTLDKFYIEVKSNHEIIIYNRSEQKKPTKIELKCDNKILFGRYMDSLFRVNPDLSQKSGWVILPSIDSGKVASEVKFTTKKSNFLLSALIETSMKNSSLQAEQKKYIVAIIRCLK